MSFPNHEQKKVIQHDGRPLVVVAAPGTGKTRTIVARMEKLLNENPNREVSFITFTRTSRKDTEKRVKNNVGEKALQDAQFNFPRISTLHTYAKSILHKYSSLVGYNSHFSILIEERGELDLIISEMIEDINLKIDPSILKKEISDFRNINKWSLNCLIPEDKKDKVLEHFSTLLRFYNTFDINGLVPNACIVLSKKPTDLTSIFLQVDEYQDLNPMDHKLINLASSTPSSKVIVVGDDAQSIYGFRNANPSGLRELWNSSEWEHLHFPNCHRLPINILRASQALISDCNYLGAQVNIPDDNGKKILTLQCTTSDLQIEAVAYNISKIIKSRKRKDGNPLSYKDFMILCPYNNFVSKVSNSLTNKFEIQTKQREKAKIPDDHWRLLLVLRMLQNKDSLALRQWLDIIGITPEKIRQYRTEALRNNKSLYSYCSSLEDNSIKEVFKHIEILLKSENAIESFRKELIDFPYLNIDNTLFPEVGITINEVTKQPNSIGKIIQLIYEKFGIYDTEYEISEEDKVLVTTMYSAKGLEAEFVFIMWLNSTFIPAKYRNQDEELRVLYVAITRAKQDVILTFHERFENFRRLKEQAMSPFLKKIYDYLDIKRIKKSDLKLQLNIATTHNI